MKKLIIILCSILVICGGILVIGKFVPISLKENTPNYSEIYDVGDLPLTVDQVPLSYELEDVEGKKMLKIQYKNSSKETITGLTVSVRLKDGEEPIQAKFNELVSSENSSSPYSIEVPQDFNIEQIKPLKYMISLQKGIYMEYDAESNQYNWS